ncbi:S8 family peptidase [Streptomyces sp. B1866]|uniref:S8 family peptidase n=1 Tax=Streptomyces sp. B1866 TaxID=3075431 RepID=UPI00288F412E|nr:S8 family peptidase [Streptomyces sp. B1866]MDT3397516.1 S8 family peptidase [Streptomyces sp. B1866]
MLAALVTASLTATAEAVPQGGRAAVPGPQSRDRATAPAAAEAAPKAVTLITGDTVAVDGQGRVRGVVHGKEREDIPISVYRTRQHTYAVPRDAAGLLARGELDRALFDVTGLVAAGYDDAHRRDVPLIVTYGSGRQRSAVRADLTRAGASMRFELPVVHGAAVSAPKTGAVRVWDALTGSGGRAAPGVAKVWLDGKRQASLDKSVRQIGAPDAWKAGYDGKGVKVAVLDTGVDQTHPDLAGQEITEKNFTDSRDSVDRLGHGTHVASTVAGTGAKSGGRYRGVASGARILDGKVLGDGGSGYDSGIIAGMQWAVDQGAKVVNLSLGGPDSPETDPMEQAIDNLSAKGTLFVVAAGNSGPAAGTISSPGSADAALTVGAVDRDDRLAFFSSRGPRQGDGAVKPDITAPGVDIVAAKAAEGQIGTPAADGYVSLSGTSMATPHVAGSAALLAQQHPDWSGQQIKTALTASAKPTADLAPFEQGSGRVDVSRAIKQTVTGEQSSLGFGVQQWPHDDDKPVTKKLTYRNLGPDPVTLDLAVDSLGPDGKPAPAGVFALAAGKVTVPGHGSADVDVTADTRGLSAYGEYSGTLVATGGGQSVRTPVAVTREAEMYDLTLRVLDAHGAPTRAQLVPLYGIDNGWFKVLEDLDEDGTVTARVPRGHYAANGYAYTPADGPERPDGAEMVAPYVMVDKDTTVTFDARQARPVDITAPQPEASPDGGAIAYGVMDASGATGFASVSGGSPDQKLSVAQIGASAPEGRFEAGIQTVWALPGEKNAGTRYSSVYSRRDGSFYTGFTHRTRLSEFARIDVTAGSPVAGQRTYVGAGWTGAIAGTGSFSEQPLPASWRLYVAGPGVTWGISLLRWSPGGDPEVSQDGPRRVRRPGRVYPETFNVGVFGPTAGSFGRYGNRSGLCVPMFGDGSGNAGRSALTKAESRLTIDGKLGAEWDWDPCEMGVDGLPPGPANYRLSTDLRRDPAVFGVSTRITAAWTFTSASPGNAGATVPLAAVRFTPELSLASTAPGGRKLTVPVVLDGLPAGESPKELTVEVSYDEGATWRPLPVRTVGGKRSVTVDNPAAGGSVSFRAHLTERDGDTVEETIYRAYTTVR